MPHLSIKIHGFTETFPGLDEVLIGGDFERYEVAPLTTAQRGSALKIAKT
jgi:hypothetical protein